MEFSTRKKIIGKITIQLYNNITPKTIKNFLSFVEGFDGYKYKGCVMHRIIPGFVIQGGDVTNNDGSGGFSIYGRYFEDENFILKHDRKGTISMANAGPDTNGSQFFITLDETPHLDNKHVVFGYVIDGLDVLDKIVDASNDNDIFISKCIKL